MWESIEWYDVQNHTLTVQRHAGVSRSIPGPGGCGFRWLQHICYLATKSWPWPYIARRPVTIATCVTHAVTQVKKIAPVSVHLACTWEPSQSRFACICNIFIINKLFMLPKNNRRKNALHKKTKTKSRHLLTTSQRSLQTETSSKCILKCFVSPSPCTTRGGSILEKTFNWFQLSLLPFPLPKRLKIITLRGLILFGEELYRTEWNYGKEVKTPKKWPKAMPTHLVNFRLISQIDISTYLKHQLIASALYLRSRWDRLRVCAWNVSSAYMAICDRLECLRFYIEWISLLNVTRHRVSPFRGRIMKSGTITWDFPSGHYATSTCPPPPTSSRCT